MDGSIIGRSAERPGCPLPRSCAARGIRRSCQSGRCGETIAGQPCSSCCRRCDDDAMALRRACGRSLGRHLWDPLGCGCARCGRTLQLSLLRDESRGGYQLPRLQLYDLRSLPRRNPRAWRLLPAQCSLCATAAGPAQSAGLRHRNDRGRRATSRWGAPPRVGRVRLGFREAAPPEANVRSIAAEPIGDRATASGRRLGRQETTVGRHP
jgi:hypothetical protein